jgi:predicted PilT family ATPase
MFRSLLYIILCCTALAPLHARAVWEFSLPAKLAIYDAVEELCRPVYPSEFENRSAETELYLFAEERSQMKVARQSSEYRETFNEVRDELAQQIATSGKDGAAKVCKDILDNQMRPSKP